MGSPNDFYKTQTKRFQMSVCVFWSVHKNPRWKMNNVWQWESESGRLNRVLHLGFPLHSAQRVLLHLTTPHLTLLLSRLRILQALTKLFLDLLGNCLKDCREHKVSSVRIDSPYEFTLLMSGSGWAIDIRRHYVCMKLKHIGYEIHVACLVFMIISYKIVDF